MTAGFTRLVILQPKLQGPTTAWFEIRHFWVTRASGIHRLSKPAFRLRCWPVRKAISLHRSSVLRLQESEAQQRQPMRVALAGHHFAGAFILALRTVAAHEAPMV